MWVKEAKFFKIKILIDIEGSGILRPLNYLPCRMGSRYEWGQPHHGMVGSCLRQGPVRPIRFGLRESFGSDDDQQSQSGIWPSSITDHPCYPVV